MAMGVRLLGTFGWKALGAASLTLGALGVALPLLPTTPFVLLAVYAFSKGSPKTARWLRSNGVFGPIIEEWEEKGAIAPPIKLLACSMMAISLFGSWYFHMSALTLTFQAVILSACAVYILSRPNK